MNYSGAFVILIFGILSRFTFGITFGSTKEIVDYSKLTFGDFPTISTSSTPAAAPYVINNDKNYGGQDYYPVSYPNAYPNAAPSAVSPPQAFPSAATWWYDVEAQTRSSATPTKRPTLRPSTLRESPLWEIPIIVDKVKSSIGACEDLLVDLTQSTGSIGKQWKNVTFVVTGHHANSSANIQSFLNTKWSLFPPGAVPSQLFVVGESYHILMKICNVYHACSSKLKVVAVTSSKIVAPSITIPGNASRFIKSSDRLRLDASVSLKDCDGDVPISKIGYLWTLRDLQNTSQLRPVEIRTINPLSLLFPAYSLSGGHDYEIALKAFYRKPGATEEVSTTRKVVVNVAYGEFIADIRGGAQQTSQVNQIFVLDARGSMDYDANPSLRVDKSYFDYRWSCQQLRPKADSCAIELRNVSTARELLTIVAGPSTLNFTSRITLELHDNRDRKGKRISRAYVDLTIVDSSVPKVEILSKVSSMKSVNVDRSLIIEGSVTTLSFCQVFWTVNDTSLTEKLSALVPRLWRQDVRRAIAPLPFNLVIPPNSIPEDTPLLFSLTCKQTSASIVVTTNGPPKPGEFVASPNQGLELSTLFTLSGVGWNDAELPISYQFGFYDRSDQIIVMQRRSESNIFTDTLPRGSSDQSILFCSLQVFDNLDAMAVKSVPVVVKQARAKDVEDRLKSVLDRPANQTMSKQEFALLSAVINNRLNCSSASTAFCLGIKRESCSVVENTCGACLPNYIGEHGSSNWPCISREDYKLLIVVAGGREKETRPRNCTVVPSSCGANEMCDPLMKKCVRRPKSCPNDCSGHGTCEMRDANTNEDRSRHGCFLGDPSCEAVCQCGQSGYTGPSCSLTAADLGEKQKLREQMFSGLATSRLELEQDNSLEAITSYASSITTLTQVPYELSSSAVAMANSANEAVLEKLSNIQDVPIDVYSSIAASLDNSMLAVFFNAESSSPSSSSGASGSATATVVGAAATTSSALISKQVELINTLAASISKTRVYNQENVEFVNSAFRLSVAAYSLSDDKNNFTLSAPRSELEKLDGSILLDSVVMAKDGPTGSSSSYEGASVTKISLTSIKAKVMLGNRDASTVILGNVVGVKVNVTGDSFANATISVPNSQSINSQTTSKENVQILCTTADVSSKKVVEHVCSSSGFKIVHTCSRVGAFSYTCPSQYARCSLVSADGNLIGSSQDIHTSKSSNGDITYCDYVVDHRRGSSRKLIAAGTSSGASFFTTTVSSFTPLGDPVFTATISPSKAPSGTLESSSANKTESAMSGTVIGIIIGVVVALLLVAFGVWWYYKSNLKKVGTTELSPPGHTKRGHAAVAPLNQDPTGIVVGGSV